jgi:tRNA threonylcarbamoyladenosine biosynthesis protein TsaB
VSSPTLLAIDAAGERCSLALVHAAGSECCTGAPGQTHLEHVMPMVEQLFARCSLRPRDCDAFAFASGPGSFTGLRVACTIVQGLALGAGRPVIAVGHLDALLRAGLDAGPGTAAGGAAAPLARALVLLDARMEQAYWAVHEKRDSAWASLAAPAVGGRDELLRAIEQWQPDFCAGDAAWILRYIGAVDVPVRDVAVEAGVVARLAQERFARGALLAPERAVPMYVRDRVAQTVAERRDARSGRPA